MSSLECKWTENEDGYWATSCRNEHEFFHDGPYENGYRYCPYCGKATREEKEEE